MNATKQNKSISAKKDSNVQENVFLLNWKAHAKMQALLKEKKFTWKSHLRQSCTKPFNFTFMYMTLFLAQSILQFWNETFYYTITVIPIQTFQIMTWMLSKLDIYHQKIHANISLIRNCYIQNYCSPLTYFRSNYFIESPVTMTFESFSAIRQDIKSYSDYNIRYHIKMIISHVLEISALFMSFCSCVRLTFVNWFDVSNSNNNIICS